MAEDGRGPEVRAEAHQRLSDLLHANAQLAHQLDPAALLETIATEARTLVRADFAGLTVLDEDGRVDKSVHVDESHIDTVRAGRALGSLGGAEFPLRLSDIPLEFADSLPERHRDITSFLGLPVVVHDRLFGTLYVVNSAAGAFGTDDESLLSTFVENAALAVENSRLYLDSERQRMWLSASADVMQRLFARDEESPLALVLNHAATGANADSATLALRNLDGSWSVHSAAGRWEARLVALAVDSADTFIGGVLASGIAAKTDDYGRDFREVVSAHGIPPRYGPIMGVPLRTRAGTVLGALSVSRGPGGEPFTSADLGNLARFSAYVGVAMELDRARDEREALRQVKDHERIAADLHDHVIQELFAASLGLSNVASTLDPVERVQVQVLAEAVDSASNRVRDSIVGLTGPKRSAEALRRAVILVTDEESRALGFAVTVAFAGHLDRAVSGELAADATAVVREALSNVARHARASAASVHVGVLGDELVIDVTDDGDGFDSGHPPSGSGLVNLRRRAVAHSGTMNVSSATDEGTHLHWTARISPTA